jgi:hypothetical protein
MMAKGTKQQLSGGRELSYIKQKDAFAGSLFSRIIDAINSTAKNAAVSAVGKLSPPPPPDSIQVAGTFNKATNTITAPSEILHFTVTHNAAIQKGIQYISEIDTNPNFTRPHQLDHGCSRTGPLTTLPAKKADGTPQVYYLRSYAQYHGSDPSKKTTVGGTDGATKIVMTGTSQMDLLPSQGSGTAKNPQQGGQGIGSVLNRPAPGPQRNLKAL